LSPPTGPPPGDPVDGPGASAIAAHVDLVDGGPPAHHVTLTKPGSVAAVSVYARDGHWHLVTYGLSELDEKVTDDRSVSGWGFELTFRLARRDDECPDWAVNLLANLAAYVFSGEHPFAAGHHLDLRGPIRLGDPTAVTAAALTLDPELGRLSGPYGAVEFLQVVGLTAEELELCRAWSTRAVMELLAESDPLLVTHLDRPSLLDDPARRERAEAGVAAEGSSLVELRVATLHWALKGRRRPRLVVTMGSGAAAALGPALRRRLSEKGATFDVVGDAGTVRFLVADDGGWVVDGATVTVSLPLAGVDGVAAMLSGRTGSGRVPAVADLRLMVVA
jgi:suppressor of fused-like protein